MKDDAFGVEEALNETAYGTGLVVRGEHSLIIGKQSNEFVLLEKTEAIRLALRPWIFITPVESTSYDDWKRKYKMQVNLEICICDGLIRHSNVSTFNIHHKITKINRNMQLNL